MLLDIVKCLCALVVTVQAGPLVLKKPRPVAGPLVDQAQWIVHQKYIIVEKEALSMSLDVSRIVQKIVSKAYLITEEAQHRLQDLQDFAEKEISLSTTDCENKFKLSESVKNTVQITLTHIYRCEHGIANRMADFEVKMTSKIIQGRSHVMEVKKAMWLCQKNLPEVDEQCLKRLTNEGLQIVHHLLDTTRPVLLETQSKGETELDEINDCFDINISIATEEIVQLTEQLRECNAQEMLTNKI